ncbi:MAG: hypothetical protein WCK35_01300 [Chloroflexota bacterium]
MSVRYVSRKCTSCGGKVEYKKEKKVWRCLYCGSEVERQEQYDGLFTIKNVARQTILDVAYGRLESAQKNLVECEKIDSRYVGSLIGRLCYLMTVLTTPGANLESDDRSVIAQIKRSYELLLEKGDSITDEEEILYEFFDSSDIYALLFLVFDTIKGFSRRDYLYSLLIIPDVYSKECNKNLIQYFLRSQKYTCVDEVILNHENLDKKNAIAGILYKYPDIPTKISNIDILLSAGACAAEDRALFEDYLAKSQDTALTKSQIVKKVFASGIRPAIEIVMNTTFNNLDTANIVDVFRQLCSSRLTDSEVNAILEYVFSVNNSDAARAVLSILKDSGQFVVISPKYLISLFSKNELKPDQKLAVYSKSLEFNVDPKSREALINNYLCFNNDAPDAREMIISGLFSSVKTIPTKTVENYLLNNTTDGERKIKVIEKIFELEVNISFFHDLLSKYISTTIDSKETMNAIILFLAGKGLKIDSKTLNRLLLERSADPATNMNFIKKLDSTGVQIHLDACNHYLESISPELFTSEMFALLYRDNSPISDKALINYVLYCKDSNEFKIKNALKLGRQNGKIFGSIPCNIKQLGNEIDCNLLQAYILVTSDSAEISNEIVKHMISAGSKLNVDLVINKTSIQKFSKYITSNKEKLSKLTFQVFENNNTAWSFSKFLG